MTLLQCIVQPTHGGGGRVFSSLFSVPNCQKRNLQSAALENICNFQEEETYYYPCPCGDRFAITKEELQCGEEVATCPSCSLIIKVILVLMVNLVFVVILVNLVFIYLKPDI